LNRASEKTIGEERRCPPEEIGVVDISAIRDTVVAVSVTLGIVFAVIELRGMARDRRTRLVLDVFSHVGTLEFSTQFGKIWNAEFKDAREAEEKCSYVALSLVARYYEGVGLLIRRGLVDADLIFESLPLDLMWNKMKPWCIEKRSIKPDSYVHFEYAAERCQAYLAETYGKGV
jgi:hypothetical protein